MSWIPNVILYVLCLIFTAVTTIVILNIKKNVYPFALNLQLVMDKFKATVGIIYL